MKKKEEIYKEIYSLDVSGYADFIENKGVIIANLIAGAPTLADIVPQTGVKAGTTVEMNILNTTINWQAGDCVTGASGSTVVAPRSVTPRRITDREEMCLDVLDAKLPMIQKPGARNEELPFANQYMDLKVALNSKNLEKLAWRGQYGVGSGNLSMADGYLKIADGETSDLGYYATFSGITAGNAISTIRNSVLANRTDIMFEADDLYINVSQQDYSIIADAIVDAYGIAGTGVFQNSGDQNQLGVQVMRFPGTNVFIRGTHGLNSNGSIFCTMKSNLRYVTDMESDRESVDLFFDKYHKALVSDLVFTIGFQYEFPENVIYIKKV